MKKVISVVLVFGIVLSLCACGKNDGEQNSYSEITTVSETAEALSVNEGTEYTTIPEETIVTEEETDKAEKEPDPDTVEMQKQYDEKSDSLQELYSAIAKEKTLPVINITTLDESKIASKEEYVKSVVDVFNCDEQYVLSAQGGVKVRGNSTADQGDEKPYRIKFDDKQGMLGLHNGTEYKSWVLLRSYWNLAPDYMAFTLAKEIFGGKYYSSDCTYVNLYLNGEYAGMYLLCEQNQAAEGRVDVYEPKSDETQNEIGYLIELDNYVDDEHPNFTISVGNAELTDINGVTRTIDDKDYSVKSNTNTNGQVEFIEKYTQGVFRILFEATSNNKPMMFDKDYNVVSAEGTYSTPKEAVEAVIDLDSAADMLILEELVHNYDVGAGSFYLAVDFSENSKYKKLTFLAPWDFNWAYYDNAYGKYYAGTYQDIMMDEDRSNYWLIMLMNADWFRDIVKEKWSGITADNALNSVTEQVRANLENLRNDLGENQWSVDTAGQIVDFVNGRIEWLNEQWSK